jgi:DNA polymerase III epsilon subunit-like protein
MTGDNEKALPQHDNNLNHDHYLFVDLETGGLYPTKHSILQIAAVITDLDFKTQGYFMSYLKPHPELEVTEFALAINQLNWDDLQNAPLEDSVVVALHHFALLRGQKGRFAGYNCKFDLEFLALMWERQNNIAAPYHVPWLDIYTCAKSKLGSNSGLPNFKLASVADFFGINTAGAHDALQDLFMTIEIAKQLKSMPEAEEKNGGADLQTAKFSIQQKELLIQAQRREILKTESSSEKIVNSWVKSD